MNKKDIILNFYSDKRCEKPYIDLDVIKNSNKLNITTQNIGLGDCIILSSLTEDTKKDLHLYSQNRHWQNISFFNRKLNQYPFKGNAIATERLEFFNIGNGHLSQRLQRSIGLNVDVLPKPYLFSNKEKNKKKIGLHFSTGPSAGDLKQHGFKNPRQLEESSFAEIYNFIKNSDFEFVEFGQERKMNLDNVNDFTKKTIYESLVELSSCEYFIGLNSGFMNAAAGFGIKSIIIVNVPDVDNLYLPVLVDCGHLIEDTNWLYPQNVHLHQYGENELVPIVSCDNIKKALNGEVYPFWKTDHLDLIF
jgi:hypothetical protein